MRLTKEFGDKEVTPEVLKIETMKQRLQIQPCSDGGSKEGSWLRAVTTLALEANDNTIPSAVNQLRDVMLETIPYLKTSAFWVDRLFGGDQQRFIKHVKSNLSPDRLTEHGVINVYRPGDIETHTPEVLDPGGGAGK